MKYKCVQSSTTEQHNSEQSHSVLLNWHCFILLILFIWYKLAASSSVRFYWFCHNLPPSENYSCLVRLNYPQLGFELESLDSLTPIYHCARTAAWTGFPKFFSLRITLQDLKCFWNWNPAECDIIFAFFKCNFVKTYKDNLYK